jgi:hypothetical protein
MVVLLAAMATGLMAQTGARFLIITYDSYYDAVQPLAHWKTQEGMLCRVVKTSQIGPNPTASQIRAYVIKAYKNWTPRPEFLLLVGWSGQLPTFTFGRGMNQIHSDNLYGDIDSNVVVELPYGRLNCLTLSECSLMVAKTLTYEEHPYLSDTQWYHRATIAVADSQDPDGDVYWADARAVTALAESAGCFDVETLSSSRQNSASDVAQSINGGTSFVLYRGEAGGDWIPPFELMPYFSSLANDSMLPILCSFTCQTLSLYPQAYDDSACICNMAPKLGTCQDQIGAVASIGNTYSTSHVALPRSAMTRGFFTRMYSDSLPYLGHAFVLGKDNILAEYSDTFDTYGFNLYGDPGLMMWTNTPEHPVLSYDTTIPAGFDTFAVNVTRAGRPVNNALVCVWSGYHESASVEVRSANVRTSDFGLRTSGDSVYDYAYTDTTGTAILTFATSSRETLAFTVTGPNCAPYEGYIYSDSGQVTGVREPEPAASLPPLTVRPSVGRGHFAIATRNAGRISVYSSAGRRISAFSTRPDFSQGAQAAVWDARQIPAGVYIIRARFADGSIDSRTIVVTR